MANYKKSFGTEVALIQAPADEDCGPALRACTAMQRRFVTALLVIPDVTRESDAARIAGYSQPANDAGQLMRNPKVIAAIREEADKRIRGGALLGARALIEIAMDQNHRQRFQAAVELLNRADLQVIAQQKIDVTHHDNRSNKELEDFIVAVAKRNGLDPKTLLGENAIEGEFVEIADDFTIGPDEFKNATGHLPRVE